MLNRVKMQSLSLLLIGALIGYAGSRAQSVGFLQAQGGEKLSQQALRDSASDDADKSGQPADRAAIRKATEEYCAAFNQGDVDGFLASWDANAEYVNEAGKATRGRKALEALFRKSLEANKGSKLKVQMTSLRFAKPDLALADGSTIVTAADGTKDTDQFTSVWIKTDGRWLISSIHDLPGEGESASLSSSEQLKQLEWLVGDWTDTVEKVDVRISCRWAENQKFLVLKYDVKQADKDFTLDQRIGWDPANGQIRSWYFDSMGGFGEGLWTRNGNLWISETSGLLPDGRAGSARNIMRFVNEKSWVFQSTDREVDGVPIADVEVGFARQLRKDER
ncbi:MAG TPA: SgcJ/EcaC family oxidoreductase [Gemmataceae bacterium]|jgi:uncharacterized protein (TIGR02246 family)|nr:SgcJ/EcaC family oxidoreductase [Gemmataceae bacterium]